jgi:hypothetical protein
MHIAEAKQTLGSRIDWICDSMDNDLKHALGDRPNSEFIVDPDGKIVVARSWSSPADLREDLQRLVGKVDQPTRIADLGLKQRPPASKAQTGVVPRLRLPGQMSPLKMEPVKSQTPHYAKLRAESGNGKLYLGFFLDPLYKVHWNNQSPPLEFSIEPPSGVRVTPDSGNGPKLSIDADADPREFLLDLQGRSDEPLKVTVRYFACDDAETFCVPVTQTYWVLLERDRDGGSRRSAGDRRGPARPAGGRPSMDEMMRRIPVLAALDANGDGKISTQEMEAAPRRLRQLDSDGDGELSRGEMQAMLRRRAGRGSAAERQ